MEEAGSGRFSGRAVGLMRNLLQHFRPACINVSRYQAQHTGSAMVLANQPTYLEAPHTIPPSKAASATSN